MSDTHDGKFYVLDGHKPLPVDGVLEWAEWFERAERQVNETRIREVRISTVFLGIDHAFFGGPPLLFETMIFGGPHDGEMKRCCTWDEAEAMHARAVEMVTSGPH